MKIIHDDGVCRGCKICELACSFHHRKVFGPTLSSIKVEHDFGSGKIGWRVDSTCDFCEGEPLPVCLKYCAFGALREVA